MKGTGTAQYMAVAGALFGLRDDPDVCEVSIGFTNQVSATLCLIPSI